MLPYLCVQPPNYTSYRYVGNFGSNGLIGCERQADTAGETEIGAGLARTISTEKYITNYQFIIQWLAFENHPGPFSSFAVY